MNKNVEKSTAEAAVTQETTAEAGLLNKILSASVSTTDTSQKAYARDMIAEFVQQLMQGQMVVSKNIEVTIHARIAQIDKLVSAQLNEVMHAEDFQKLEASWRGLHHMVFQSETGTMLKIRVMNATKRELMKDMERAPEFDQSALFVKIYEQEYGTFGGAPFGSLIGDYEFSNHPEDIALLEKVSNVSAAAHAPFVAAASPELFGWNDFTKLTEVRDLAKIFERTEYAKWRSFRESEDSRYVGLCLPHTLMRLPYGKETTPTETFNFEEDVDGTDHRKYLWGNAAYSFGTRLTESFAQYHWCASIRGVEGGGLVQGLPTHTFRTDEGDVALKCPTEISITDRREKEFSDLGFLSLVHCKNTDYAAFFGGQSCNKAKKYDTDFANANSRLSAQLPYIFSVSRFAHYLKVMMRDKIGSAMSRSDCERYLNQWISNYVTPDDNASAATKAQFPLREARIEVSEVAGKPGVLKAVAFMRPHFQLDELTVSLRLVAELPKQAR
ncbi:MAG: type VI secretion system contractile sheath large subunit [Acidobacteria bacterium]|nr:type VI secretion system contractile sheath large subunit [Acidobacteriota bacterium]MBI3655365.1 type VI secretion system contractile sheath large subunit [Acidobacteriota bacterium]